MSDVDAVLRERLAAAAAFDLDADPQRVREGVTRRQRRIRRRRRGAVVLGVVAVAALAVGVVRLADDGGGGDEDLAVDEGAAPDTPDASTATGPLFRPASGWNTVQTPGGAVAANVPLGPETASGSVPWDTVSQLGDGDVVVFAMVHPSTEVSRADGSFPPRDLPLSLDDAEPGGLEGQPDGVYAERLLGEVDGWNVDVVVFYGAADPSAETRAAAQEQLARLVVPNLRVAETPSAAAAGTCRPSDLEAQVALDGSGGALAGHITVRNVGQAACTLSGQAAAVEPRDTNSTVLPSTTSEAQPAWRQAGDAAPRGWPAVEVAAGAEAQAVLSVRNWCGAFQNRLYFVIRLPGQAERIGGPAPSVQAEPQCQNAQAPMELTVGPFEPARPAG